MNMAYAGTRYASSTDAGIHRTTNKSGWSYRVDNSHVRGKMFSENSGATLSQDVCVDCSKYILSPRDSWLVKVYERIRKIEELKDGWNGEGSKTPSRTALYNTNIVVESLHLFNLKPHNIVPSADDGITLTFYKGERGAIIDCYNDATIVVQIYEGDRTIDLKSITDDVSALNDAIRSIDERLH